MLPITEIIFSGFVSKVVNDIVDVSKDRIKKAVKSKNTKYQNVESQIYNVIVDVLNKITGNRYKNEQDNIYDAAEALFKSLKENSRDELEYIKSCLQVLGLNSDQDGGLRFKVSLYEELGKNEYGELFRAILLLQLEHKHQYDHVVYEQLNQKLDEVIIILNRKDGGDERNNERQKVKSRTLEYANKWNANMFLNDFDKRDQNAGTNVKLSDVYLEEHLPHYIWKDNDEEEPLTDLKELLSEYIIEKRDSQMLLILGQPGIGKSTLITWITANFADRINDILVYRFASDLGKTDWKSSSRVSNRILEELGLDYSDLKGKTLILDGFDEVSIENNKRRDILDSLYGDWIYNETIEQFSLIVTCRENYVQRFAILKCKYITLQPWNEMQIKSFCNVFQEKTKNVIFESTIEKLFENKEILGIPLILYMVLALNISIEKEGSIVDVYDKIFSLEGGIYDRCIDNKMFAAKHRIGEVKKQIHQISKTIAIWIFENNSEEAYIPMEEYEKKCDNIIRKDNSKEKSVKLDYLIGNYFRLVKHCEGMDTKELYFVHRTIYEYFTSEYIFKAINDGINYNNEKIAGILGDLFKKSNMSKEILDFLKYKIEKSRLKNEYDRMYKIFELMIKDGMTFYTNKCFRNVFACEINIFYNMLEFLHLWENCHLKLDNSISCYLYRYRFLPLYPIPKSYERYIGLNLSGADLTQVFFCHADLKNSNMSDTNLKGTSMHWMDLSNINFTNSNLENVIFLKCSLDNVDFEGANMIGVILSYAEIFNANFHNANLEGANFVGANIQNVFMPVSSPDKLYITGGNFEGLNLKKTGFMRAKLKKANFKKANLEDADFREADIENADFSQANIKGTVFDDSQIKDLEHKYDLHGTKIFIKGTEEILDYEVYCKNWGKEQ